MFCLFRSLTYLRYQVTTAVHSAKVHFLRHSLSRPILHSTDNLQVAPVTSEENADRYCKGGYHPVRLGETFHNRYQVLSKLGYGVYSTVWLARDLSTQPSQHVALKILTADSYGSTKPTYELEILKHMKRTDHNHPGYERVIHLLDNFIHEGQNGSHLCLVTDLMGYSVLQLQECFPGKQLPAQLGRQIAKQVLEGLDWLHYSCGVIHTDLKPDNILIEISNMDVAIQNHLDKLDQYYSDQPGGPVLVSRPILSESASGSSNLKIRIADFGVASWNDNHLTEWVQPPSLRAREVFLGGPWSYNVDIWGFACVIYELVQGRVLFRGRSGPNGAWTAEEDQIAQMMELFGPFPENIRRTSRFTDKYFTNDGELRHIKQLYPCSLDALLAQTNNASMSASDYESFDTFLRNMLEYEPSRRKLPKELLQEVWLRASNTESDTS